MTAMMRVATLVMVGSLVTALPSCATHEDPPTLDGPTISLAAPTCDPSLVDRASSETPSGVSWRPYVRFPSYRSGLTAQTPTLNVSVENLGPDSESVFTASGSAQWTSKFPYEVQALSAVPGTLVAQMWWYHAVGIGDEPGDSAGIVAAIDSTDGGVRWWYPYAGIDRPPSLGAVAPELTILLVDSFTGCMSVHAIDTVTGAEMWTVGIPQEDDPITAVAITGENVYIRLQSSAVVAPSASTGEATAH